MVLVLLLRIEFHPLWCCRKCLAATTSIGPWPLSCSVSNDIHNYRYRYVDVAQDVLHRIQVSGRMVRVFVAPTELGARQPQQLQHAYMCTHADKVDEGLVGGICADFVDPQRGYMLIDLLCWTWLVHDPPATMKQKEKKEC